VVRVSCRVRVRFNNSHLSRKSRTVSYLAMRHIWHDTDLPATCCQVHQLAAVSSATSTPASDSVPVALSTASEPRH